MKIKDGLVGREAVIDRVRRVLSTQLLLSAYVYGSYANGTPSIDSDIDVLIVSQEPSSQLYKKLSLQFWNDPVPVEMVVYDEATFKSKLKDNQLVMSIVNKGIKII